jgi:hypothetical protein
VTDIDPTLLPLDELRALRSHLLGEEDAVSYVRRLVQARIDLVDAELRRRRLNDEAVTPEALSGILASRLTGGPARPPRPAVDASEHPLAVEFDDLCTRLGAAEPSALTDSQLASLRDELRSFEQARSVERQALFQRIDALSAELVHRYREGEADIEGLLADE